MSRNLRRIVWLKCLVVSATLTGGCVAPKFFTDIPANSTPVRTARYYRTQDWQNLAAGAAVDELGRLIWHGPTDHVGMGDRQVARCDAYFDSLAVRHCAWRWTDSVQSYSFKWRSGETSPVYRIAAVVVLGGIRRQTDKGYRESGWLFNVGGALLTEWAHAMVAAIRGHF